MPYVSPDPPRFLPADHETVHGAPAAMSTVARPAVWQWLPGTDLMVWFTGWRRRRVTYSHGLIERHGVTWVRFTVLVQGGAPLGRMYLADSPALRHTPTRDYDGRRTVCVTRLPAGLHIPAQRTDTETT